MDDGYQEYYALEHESETERDHDEMLESDEWAQWQDKGRSVTDLMADTFISLTK